MELVAKRFEALTVDELYEILRIRVSVFVVEQSCPYQEVDGTDRQALHVYLRDGGGIQAYLRLMGGPGTVTMGRVIAVKRRQGLGGKILSEGIALAKNQLGASAIEIEAQTYARELYEKQGFRQTSEEFLEDGIPHIRMVLTCIPE